MDAHFSWKALKRSKRSYLRGLYSFCENFGGSNGHVNRKALYGKLQWFHTADGQWHEQTEATFSHDPTGKIDRLDRFYGDWRTDSVFPVNRRVRREGFTKYGELLLRGNSN